MDENELREMDAAIGEEVMGWDRDGELVRIPGANTGFNEPPDFSDANGFGAMAMVLKRMSQLGYWAVLKTPFTDDGSYSCGFTPKGVTGWNGRPDYFIMAESLPLAVCGAALLVVRGQSS